MSDSLLHRKYREWPLDPVDREALAREILGEHIVGAYDDWLQIAADMVFGDRRTGALTDEQRAFLDWIASLGDEERVQAFAFVRELLEDEFCGFTPHNGRGPWGQDPGRG